MRCFKCHKYEHHREICKGHKTCGKCDLKEPNHTENECPNEAKSPNCLENPAYSKIGKSFKKEKEIVEVKYKENSKFPSKSKRLFRHRQKFKLN